MCVPGEPGSSTKSVAHDMSFRSFSRLFRRDGLRIRNILRTTDKPQGRIRGTEKKVTPNRTSKFILSAAVLGGAGFVGYQTSEPFRHTCVASVRCCRIASECWSSLNILLFLTMIAGAVVLGILCYVEVPFTR